MLPTADIDAIGAVACSVGGHCDGEKVSNERLRLVRRSFDEIKGPSIRIVRAYSEGLGGLFVEFCKPRRCEATDRY